MHLWGSWRQVATGVVRGDIKANGILVYVTQTVDDKPLTSDRIPDDQESDSAQLAPRRHAVHQFGTILPWERRLISKNSMAQRTELTKGKVQRRNGLKDWPSNSPEKIMVGDIGGPCRR